MTSHVRKSRVQRLITKEHIAMHTNLILLLKPALYSNILIGASLSEPHTSKSDGTSDRLQTITIKHGKLVYSSIDNLNYTENSRNGLLTIYLTEMAH